MMLLAVLALLLLPITTIVDARTPTSTAVLQRDQIHLHKYSAILAAIEPFRLQLKEELKRSMNPLRFLLHELKGINLDDPNNGLRSANQGTDLAYSRYENRINDIVRSYHMNIQAFNELSRKVLQDSSLKRNVLRQAYHYRVAADLESLAGSALPILPLPKSVFSDAQMNPSYGSPMDSELTRYCRALRTIESERIKIRETLQSDLGMKTLPPRMCDPELRPIMCRQVQHACQNYPIVAGRIVEQMGLPNDRFDVLNDQAKINPFFRFQVQREIARLEREEKKQ